MSNIPGASAISSDLAALKQADAARRSDEIPTKAAEAKADPAEADDVGDKKVEQAVRDLD